MHEIAGAENRASCPGRVVLGPKLPSRHQSQTSSSAPPYGQLVSFIGRTRQNFSEHVVDVLASIPSVLPLLRITERDLFKPDTINVISPPDMEMSCHDHLSIEPCVPVLSLLRAAPETEPWDSWYSDKIVTKWPMVDDDQRQSTCSSLLKTRNSLLDELIAPLVPCFMGIWV